MQIIIHKLFRYRRKGANVVADLNAAIAAGTDGSSSASARSYGPIVQRNGRSWTESEAPGSKDKEVNVNDVEGDS